MNKPPGRVSVMILDKEYLVSCTDEEQAALKEAAELVTERMREVRDGGRVVGAERIAVMVALNLANEVLQLRRREVKLEGTTAQIRALRERVEAALPGFLPEPARVDEPPP